MGALRISMKKPIFAALCITLAFVVSLYAAWPNSYTYRRIATVQSNQISGPSASYPLYLAGTLADLPATLNGTTACGFPGSAITCPNDFFVSGQGGESLSATWEAYNNGTGAFGQWIIPNNLANGGNVQVYYGNTGVLRPPQGGYQYVWPKQYKGVYDFGDGTTVSGYDATINSKNLTNVSATASAGVIGGAATFNGTSAHIGVLSAPQSTYPLTISVLAKPNSGGGVMVSILDKDSATWNGFYLSYGSGSFTTACVSNNNFFFAATLAASSGSWHSVKAVYTSATSRTIYVDGVQGTTDTASCIPTVTPNSLSFGAAGRTIFDNFYSGSLDEARITNIAETQAQATTEYNNQMNTASFWSFSNAIQYSSPGNSTGPVNSASVGVTPQRFWQYVFNEATTRVRYNDNCVGADCAGAIKNGMSLTGAITGDVVDFEWAFDNNLYSSIDDTCGANYTACLAGNNLSVIKIADPGKPSNNSWVVTLANQMTGYGALAQLGVGACTASENWKALGIKAATISGTHYQFLIVGCNIYQAAGAGCAVDWIQCFTTTSVVMTTNNWSTVTNAAGTTNATGATPATAGAQMFSDARFTAPSWVRYGGQDGACPGVDGCSTYTYLTSIGCFTGCSGASSNGVYLQRILTTDLPLLDKTKYQCYKGKIGGDVTDAANWATTPSALCVPVYTEPWHLGTASFTYVSATGKYVAPEFWWPSVEFSNVQTTNNTRWGFLQCDKLTGPCYRTSQILYWGNDNIGRGYYSPAIIGKWSDLTTGALWMTYAGDYGTNEASPNTTLYSIFAAPLTIQ